MRTISFRLAVVVVVMGWSAGLLSQAGAIRTIAGGGSIGVTASSAFLNLPSAVAVDVHGNLYVDVAQQDEVIKIDPRGKVSVVAGTGYAGYSGDGGPATRATLDVTNLYTDVVAGLALDPAGNLYISDYANNVVRRVDLASGIITTVAGNGTAGYSGDGGPAAGAELFDPSAIALDPEGNLYILDGNNVVRRVDAVSGVISTLSGSSNANLTGGVAADGAGDVYVTTYTQVVEIQPGGNNVVIAGNGAQGYSGDGGPAAAAMLNLPTALLLDGRGNLVIADSGNNAIRSLNLQSGTISTLAGAGGVPGYSGDGGRAIHAALNIGFTAQPVVAVGSLAEDPAGDIYIPDAFNMRVREISAANGDISTVAGGGTGDGVPALSAPIGFVTALQVTSAGGLLVSQASDGRVRAVPAQGGVVATYAGDGLPTSPAPSLGDGDLARLADTGNDNFSALDAAGNLYLAEGNLGRVRRVDARTGIITTVAGTGRACTSADIGDGGPATSACLTNPNTIALDAAGDLYIIERGGRRIRRVDANGIITTVAGTGSSGCTGDGGPAVSAQLEKPVGMAIDAEGNLYFGDCNNIRRIDGTSGIITTIAGNGTATLNGESGPAANMSIGFARGIVADELGNLFLADTQFNRIRRLDKLTGALSTIAGTGSSIEGNGAFSGDGGLATQAQLNAPYALALEGERLFIGDSGNNRVREMELPPFLGLLPASVDFGSQPLHSRSVQEIAIANTGTSPLRVQDIQITGPQARAFHLEGLRCRGEIATGEQCTLRVVFQAQRQGNASATLSVVSDAVLSLSTVPLAGAGR